MATEGQIVPSQEPQLPSIGVLGGEARSRVQTRRSKVNQAVTMQEETPTGDQIEVREVKQASVGAALHILLVWLLHSSEGGSGCSVPGRAMHGTDS
jgi:hypothetical protein